MQNLLKEKYIAVGVTGSIAIYKTLELIRLFIKSGAKVKVVMSESAKEFITPLTFEAISQNMVLNKESESWSNDNNHIGISKWADVFVVAPASANTVNKISAGIADNLLLESILAYDKPLVIAPSANTKMYKNPNTQGSLKKLKVFGNIIVEPQTKLLACNDEGIGAMAEPVEIFYEVAKELLKDDFWVNRRVVVTGGGTIERIDDVRYISNFSSGKMAAALSTALYLKGADVCLVSTTNSNDLPKGIYNIKVESSQDMKEMIEKSIFVAKKGIMSKPNISNSEAPKLIQKKPYLFMAAAVSDFVPDFSPGKIKKDKVQEDFQLKLKKNIDILSSIDKEGIVSIGFKAELDKNEAQKNALNMLKKKKVDAVCLNLIDEENKFGDDKNSIDFITKDNIVKIGKDKKLNVSLKILELAKGL